MKFIPRLVEEDEEEGIIVKPLDDTRTYSADAIADVFDREYDLSEDDYLEIYGILTPTWSNTDEMEAAELKTKLSLIIKRFNDITQEEFDDLVEKISHTKNPKAEKIADFKEDILWDIDMIGYLLEGDTRTETGLPLKLRTHQAYRVLEKAIEELKEIEYSDDN